MHAPDQPGPAAEAIGFTAHECGDPFAPACPECLQVASGVPARDEEGVEASVSDCGGNLRRVAAQKPGEPGSPGDVSEYDVPITLEQRNVPGEVDSEAHSLLLGVRQHAVEHRQVNLGVGGESPEVGSVVLDRVCRQDPELVWHRSKGYSGLTGRRGHRA